MGWSRVLASCRNKLFAEAGRRLATPIRHVLGVVQSEGFRSEGECCPGNNINTIPDGIRQECPTLVYTLVVDIYLVKSLFCRLYTRFWCASRGNFSTPSCPFLKGGRVQECQFSLSACLCLHVWHERLFGWGCWSLLRPSVGGHITCHPLQLQYLISLRYCFTTFKTCLPCWCVEANEQLAFSTLNWAIFPVCFQEVEGVQQWAFKAAASALEVIPRTLAQNCGTNVVRVLTQLRVSA